MLSSNYAREIDGNPIVNISSIHMATGSIAIFVVCSENKATSYHLGLNVLTSVINFWNDST